MSERPPSRRYTVVRRQMRPVRIELHPILVGALAVFALVLLAWSGATTSYALFRDEFLKQIADRHAAVERAATAEISRLRADLARTNSRMLIERENFTSRFETLAQRQADIERRHETLAKLAGQTRTGEAPEEIDGDLRLGDDMTLRESYISPDRPGRVLASGFDTIEREQKAMMGALNERLDEERETVNGVYAALGLTVPESPVKAGLGGLYLPFSLGRTDPVTRDLASLEDKAADVGRLRAGLDLVPVRSPAPGAPFSSSFGNRLDPFLGKMAFHSGIDLEVASGTPARATAAGKILSAGWNGGYGLAVDIEHAHGYVTRYAHLSKVSVTEGEDVTAGQVIGRTGSTGRSTGPHLHYETRHKDVAVDPRRFLKAGKALN